jgi:hypothetical protein
MKVKNIIIILAVVATCIAGAGAWFYYSTLEQEESISKDEFTGIEQIASNLTVMTGLPLKLDFDVVQINRNELEEFLLEELNKEKENLTIAEKIYTALHVWDENSSFIDAYLNFTTEQVAGMYDSKENILYEVLGEDMPMGMRKFILAHELTHALQDQNFPEIFEKVDKGECSSSDELNTLMALIEGHATLIQNFYLKYLSPEEQFELLQYSYSMMNMNATTFENMDPFIFEMLLFPYLKGQSFLTSLFLQGGLDKVNGVFLDPPYTTEQIIHPDKYLAGEKPAGISLELKMPTGWTEVDQDSLGEGFMWIVLKQHIPEMEAGISSSGWDGDIYSYWENESNYLFLWKQNWDSENDAREFFNSWHSYTESWLSDQGGSLEPLPTGSLSLFGEEQLFQAGNTYVYLKQDGNKTKIIESDNLRVLRRARKASSLLQPLQIFPHMLFIISK